jgi:hypothetical protein
MHATPDAFWPHVLSIGPGIFDGESGDDNPIIFFNGFNRFSGKDYRRAWII